jgi:hypothetical protein
MRIEIDSELNFYVQEGDEPLIFLPLVDFEKLKGPSIIDPF